MTTPSGWDFNLTRHRVETPSPDAANGLRELADAGSGHYLVSIEGELFSGSDAGAAQVFPFDGKRVTLGWHPKQSDLGPNYAVQMLLDLYDYPVNAAPSFNWYALMDHAYAGGGPFCHPLDLVTEIVVNPNWWTPAPGSAIRFFVGAGFAWEGKSRGVEINFAHAGWGTQYPRSAEIMSTSVYPNGGEFVAIFGEEWGISATEGKDNHIRIVWQRILDTLMTRWDDNRGHPLFTPPTDTRTMLTEAVFVGMELYAPQITNNAIGNLWLTDFRNSDAGRE